MDSEIARLQLVASQTNQNFGTFYNPKNMCIGQKPIEGHLVLKVNHGLQLCKRMVNLRSCHRGFNDNRPFQASPTISRKSWNGYIPWGGFTLSLRRSDTKPDEVVQKHVKKS